MRPKDCPSTCLRWNPRAPTLLTRQVARTLLAQVFRLTDTVLDLFFADQHAQAASSSFAETFLDWACSKDPSAHRLRGDAKDWLTHLRLIVDSSLDGAGRSWRDLARKESWDQLHKLTAVLGVTGGSGAHRTATRQFRTPSLPRVIVCTDTLKEGVDLHLFCDRVLHYGVAWTSGDLEQRVGRVDRFFSQIERRLSEAEQPDVALEVGYPHVVASLEKAQIDRVIERQRRAERLMDSPLGGIAHEDRELVIGASNAPKPAPPLGPFSTRALPSRGRSIVSVSAKDADAVADHYTRWYGMLVRGIGSKGWVVKPGDVRPVREATLVGQGRQHELAWAFDAALGRYTLTLSAPPLASDVQFSGGKRRRTIDRTKKVESFARLLVPTPEEGQDDEGVVQMIELLEGRPPRICSDARSLWGEAAEAVSDGDVQWLSEHKAEVTVARGDRGHTVSLYAYEGGTRIVGIVADLDDLMERPEWGGVPTKDSVGSWALDTTNDLPLGYLDIHPRDGLIDALIFGVHVLHGRLSKAARGQLLQQVAWRADQWEASLTGEDRR